MNFVFEFDWDVHPDKEIDQGFDDIELLKNILNHTYFLPVDLALKKLLADEDYKKAISEHIRLFKVGPKETMYVEYGYSSGVIEIKKNFNINFKSADSDYVEAARLAFIETVEKCLN